MAGSSPAVRSSSKTLRGAAGRGKSSVDSAKRGPWISKAHRTSSRIMSHQPSLACLGVSAKLLCGWPQDHAHSPSTSTIPLPQPSPQLSAPTSQAHHWIRFSIYWPGGIRACTVSATRPTCSSFPKGGLTRSERRNGLYSHVHGTAAWAFDERSHCTGPFCLLL